MSLGIDNVHKNRKSAEDSVRAKIIKYSTIKIIDREEH